MIPIVAIVGRPNVGKSTLFNRILGVRKAIVADEPGVTRDLNFAETEESGRSFTIVDTGGFDTGDGGIRAQVSDQARLAIEDADVIVLLMDGKIGPVPQDMELVDMLRRSGKTAIYAVNKIDSLRKEADLSDFYTLGMEDIYAVSAEQGRGLNELMDAILAALPTVEEEPPADGERIKVAIVGRPNVGKSSILNRLIGRKRAIVSDVAGTTRDAVDTPFDLDGRRYLIIDTAGIRKKSKVSLTVESYCVMEALRTIERCDCAILVLDAGSGVTAQDEKIAGLIEDRKKCSVIVVNKWDLVEKDTKTADFVKDTIRRTLPFISYAPVLFTSALTGQRVPKILEAIDSVVEKSRLRVTTSNLNGILEGLVSRQGPPEYRGKEVRFYYATQTGVSPPTFVIFTNFPEGIKDSYRRYMINSLRESLGIDAVPVRLFFRKRH